MPLPSFESIFGVKPGPTPKPLAGLGSASLSPGTLPSFNSLFPETKPPEPPKPALPGPLGYVTGMVGNLVGDIGEMAQGITSLIGAVGHDVIAGVQELVPGEQSVESEGYRLAAIAKALPGAIYDDYKSRYGSPSGLARGLYEDPLSYLLDIVGLGAVAAKGAEIGAKVGLVSEATASKVLGGGLLRKTAATADFPEGKIIGWDKPTLSFGSLSGKILHGGEQIAQAWPITVSKNPVVRTVEKKLLDYGSWSADEAKALYLAGEFGDGSTFSESARRARMGVNTAIREGLRVFKPVTSKAFENSLFSRANSAMKLHKKVKADSLQQELTAILDDPDLLKLPPEERNKLVVDYLETRQVPDHIIYGGAVEGFNPIPADLSTTTLSPASIRQAGDLAIDEALVNEFVEGVTRNNLKAPHNMNPDPDALRFRVTVERITAATVEEIRRRVEKATGRKAVEGYSYLDEATSYDGVHLNFQGEDGRIFEVSVATKDMAQVQRAWSSVSEIMGETTRRLNEAEETLLAISDDLQAVNTELKLAYHQSAGRVTGHPGPGRIDELERLKKEYGKQQTATGKLVRDYKKEIAAAEAYQRQLANIVNRTIRADEMADEGAFYDPALRASDRIRVWEYHAAMETWLKKDGGTFTDYWARAYGPRRVKEFYELTTGLGEVVKSAYRKVFGNRRFDPDAEGLQFAQVLSEIRTHLSSLTDADGVTPWLSQPEIRTLTNAFSNNIIRRGPNYAFKKFKWKFRNMFRERLIVHGDGAGFEWYYQLADDITNGHLVPGYFPHIRADRVQSKGDYLMRTSRMESINANAPSYAKHWRGFFAEGGKVLDDPMEVYSRLAHAYARHEELMDFVNSMVPFGRELSPEEVKLYHAGKYGPGYKIWAPSKIKKELELIPLLFDEMMAEMAEGTKYYKALGKVMEGLEERIRQQGLDALGGAKVYLMPTHIADQVARQAALALGWKMRMFFDGPMNMWRASVLSLSPRWIVNNVLGNLVFMGTHAPNAIKYWLQTAGKRDKALFKMLMSEEEYAEMAGGRFFASEALSKTHYGSAEGTKTAALAHKIVEGPYTGVARPLNPVATGVRKLSHFIKSLNQSIEQAAARGIFLDEFAKKNLTTTTRLFHGQMTVLRHAATVGWNDKSSFRQFVDGANRVLGDYVHLSPFERQIMRRVIMPFYPFYRHMTLFALKMPIDHPFKTQVFRYLQEIDKDISGEMPDFLRGSTMLGELGGKDVFFRVKSMNPLSAINEQIPFAGALNPFIKTGLEQMLGYDTFLGEEFTNPEDIVETIRGERWRIIRDGDGNVINVEPLDGPYAPPLWKHLAGQVPPIPLIFPSMERYPKPLQYQLLGMIGVPTTEYDLAQWQARQAMDQVEAFQRAVRTDARLDAEL